MNNYKAANGTVTAFVERLGWAPLVVLNLIPLYGVFALGWQSFDLIFLYWFENVLIGGFIAARMILRPYESVAALLPTLFITAFFTVHYGGFCFGHGIFVFSLFGPEDADGFGDIVPLSAATLANPGMLIAVSALALLQVFDWLREIAKRGLGGEAPRDLMAKPYRRIIVLHVALIAGGIVMGELGEPVLGLLVLIVVKTVSDVYHWRKERAVPAVDSLEI